MEDYQLYFPNFKHSDFLIFQSTLTGELAASAEWLVEGPVEHRGRYINEAKFLKLFGKKDKDRKKLLLKIIKVLATVALSGAGGAGGYLILNDGSGRPLFEINIHNTVVNVYSADKTQKVTIDSAKLNQEIHKIDSLEVQN